MLIMYYLKQKIIIICVLISLSCVVATYIYIDIYIDIKLCSLEFCLQEVGSLLLMGTDESLCDFLSLWREYKHD